ncbi:hypothetical protein JY651_36060 [Pyxidicoccus parkwayensis]|uniref:Lipoprotein n=1 Tax=Pyxidicoccus parkwayensis TaxID=2813578 RepID=A0ABX7NPA3_9BACT|nr:hypothetical protein [Pyxidicoccus parkwaysis]QSQ20615.1 hypothetical protein JY651_36060 [Pyxidicoccus parkwaysis]
MVQAGGHRVLAGLLGATLLLGLGGCSSQRASAKVNEDWLARVPPAQMESVNQARITQNKAQDETTRARVSAEDAKRELSVAEKNEKAAKTSVDAQKKAVEAANKMGQADRIAQAQQAQQQAEQAQQVAQAEVDFRKQVVKTRDAMEKMRARELDVANAELSKAEYQALVNSGDTRAEKLKAQDFDNALTKARSEAALQQKEVEALLQQQRDAQAKWQQLDSQVKAYGGSGR